MRYAAKFLKDKGGGYVVSFRDIPEAITQGDTEAEALEMAQDALVTAMDFYFEDRRSVPLPSAAKRGERLVELPPSLAAKVLLLNEMLAQHVTAAELARKLGTSPQSINRLTNISHATKIDAVATALQALGKRLEVSLA